jgi:hypothetical protein
VQWSVGIRAWGCPPYRIVVVTASLCGGAKIRAPRRQIEGGNLPGEGPAVY